MTEWVWPRLDVVMALHEEHLAEHGGKAGLRDAGLLDSALARPRHHLAYAPAADAADLAACLAHGIARNHPFLDGNKRTALVTAELFLTLNGHDLTATDAECVQVFMGLAAGEIDEAGLAEWFRAKIRRSGPCETGA